MVDVMGRKFKPYDPERGEEWEGAPMSQMEPLENTVATMVCCDNYVYPDFEMEGGILFAIWRCPNVCGNVMSHAVGEVNNLEASCERST